MRNHNISWKCKGNRLLETTATHQNLSHFRWRIQKPLAARKLHSSTTPKVTVQSSLHYMASPGTTKTLLHSIVKSQKLEIQICTSTILIMKTDTQVKFFSRTLFLKCFWGVLMVPKPWLRSRRESSRAAFISLAVYADIEKLHIYMISIEK